MVALSDGIVAEKEALFKNAIEAVKERLGTHYEIDVKVLHPSENDTFHSLGDDRMADFNGLLTDENGNKVRRSISMRADLPVDAQLHALLHLFGHIVQANTGSEAWLAAETVEIGKVTDTQLESQKRYEHEAARYGRGLLEECGITDPGLMQWYSKYHATDLKFLAAAYRGEEKEIPVPGTDMIKLLGERLKKYEVTHAPEITTLKAPPLSSFREHKVQHSENGRQTGARVL